MIIDDLANAARYYSIHPSFREAFEYLINTDLTSLPTGETEISAGVKGIVMDKPGMTREESLSRFECHQQNIDIQLCISGTEEMGWRPKNTCSAPQADFDPERDVQFFNDQPDMFFKLKPGQFAVFFPEDVHAPMISEGQIKKIVMKIRI